MAKDVTLRLNPQQASSSEFYLPLAAQKCSEKLKNVTGIRILKKSIDARKKQIWINMTVRVFLHDEQMDEQVPDFKFQDVSSKPPVIVVGCGPAGLFAGLALIEQGLKPIILERGKAVDERKRDLAIINRNMKVDPDSNYGFGEGGAGTFSDGKLYTRSVKRGNVNRILQLLVFHGAQEEILYDAHPHIGTDRLPKVIKNIRETIIASGGEVHFSTRVNDFILEGRQLKGVRTHDNKEYIGPVILATGHSARDVYARLHHNQVALETKTFAMGVRVEHPQKLIDQIQYHNPKGRGQYLPAASYNLTAQSDERGVYSFCMCPGGFIVPAATGPNEQVVNGMSPSNRGSKWANSGIVVEIRPEDIDPNKRNILAGLQMQQDLEKQCYIQANETLQAPAQRLDDFLNNRFSNSLPSTSYVPGLISSNLHEWLPNHISKRLQDGFTQFGRRAKGFVTNEAIITGVESRTSSPIRIPRDRETFEHVTIKNLYPCGEGAGYAGGIVSSAIDGENCARALAERFTA